MCLVTKKEQLIYLNKGELNCQDIESLLFDYVEGGLFAKLKEDIGFHIEGCKECESMLTDYLLIIKLASSIKHDSVEMPNDAKVRLRERLSKELSLEL